MYKENDNLNKEEIDKFRSMSQTERDKLLAEKEKEILKEKKKRADPGAYKSWYAFQTFTELQQL